jgi:hypothetical protein
MKLYSGIFISKPAQTKSMFVYLTWNKNGKQMKTMLEYHKAELMFKEMEKLKVEPHIVFESTCYPNSSLK